MLKAAAQRLILSFIGTKTYRRVTNKMAVISFKGKKDQFPKSELLRLKNVTSEYQLKDNYYIYCICTYNKYSPLSWLIKFMSKVGGDKTKHTHTSINYSNILTLEMLADGGRATFIDDFVKRYTKITVVRFKLHKGAYQEVRESLNHFIHNIDMYEYDYQMLINNGKYLEYCAEYPYTLLEPFVDMKTSDLLGRVVVTPDDIVESGETVFRWKA